MEAASPEKKTFSPAFAVAALVLVVALGLRAHAAWQSRKPTTAELTLRGKTFTVEIADTDKKKERGLGGRDRLAEDAGMYFPFPAADRWIFWMKDMRFPIDILWIREGKVVDIDASVPVVPEGQELVTYSPVEPADAVLELNAGVAESLGVKVGDAIAL